MTTSAATCGRTTTDYDEPESPTGSSWDRGCTEVVAEAMWKPYVGSTSMSRNEAMPTTPPSPSMSPGKKLEGRSRVARLRAESKRWYLGPNGVCSDAEGPVPSDEV